MNLNIFKNKYIKWTEYILSTLILMYLGYYVGFGNIYSAFQNFNVYYLAIAFLLFIFAFLLNFFSLYFLFRPLLRIPLFDFLKYRGYSVALGIFTPMKIGELSLSVIFKKEYKISIFRSTLIILFDKFITFVVVSFIFCATYFILVYFFQYSFLLSFQRYFLILLFIIILSFFIFIYSYYSKSMFFKIKFLGKHIEKFFNSFFLLYKIYKNHINAPFMDLLFTFLSAIKIVIPSYILFRSLGFNINFFYLLFIASAAGFFSLIPFTLSGFGVREAFVVYLYSLVNIPPPVSLAMMLIFLLFRYSVPFLFILFFNFSKDD